MRGGVEGQTVQLANSFGFFISADLYQKHLQQKFAAVINPLAREGQIGSDGKEILNFIDSKTVVEGIKSLEVTEKTVAQLVSHGEQLGLYPEFASPDLSSPGWKDERPVDGHRFRVTDYVFGIPNNGKLYIGVDVEENRRTAVALNLSAGFGPQGRDFTRWSIVLSAVSVGLE